MNSITGITFFFYEGELFGVHPHYSDEESALSTYERFPVWLRPQIVWNYLPISKSDPITALGTIVSEQEEGPPIGVLGPTKLDFRIRTATKLTGITAIGPQFMARAPVQCSSKFAPITLIYAEIQEGRSTWLSSRDSSHYVLPSPPIAPIIPRLNGQTAYWSAAPLENVSSAVIFYDPSNLNCRGILFHYLDGACRAIGQCRLHVDPTVVVVKPPSFCFRAEAPSTSSTGVEVTFRHDDQHDDSEEWKCYPMQGYVDFWCSGSFSCLEFHSKPVTDDAPELNESSGSSESSE